MMVEGCERVNDPVPRRLSGANLQSIAPPPLDPVSDNEDYDDALSDFKRELYKVTRSRRTRNAPMPCVLLEDLLMSDEKGVRSVAHLQSLGVTHVLNLAKGDTASRAAEYAAAGIAYLEIDAFDRPDYDILGQHFDEAFAFYKAARETPSAKVVVHCLGGVNRSGLVATAMYMWVTRQTLIDAATFVNSVRGAYLWNDSFRDQLVFWSAEQHLLGKAPVTDSPCVKLPTKFIRPLETPLVPLALAPRRLDGDLCAYSQVECLNSPRGNRS